MLGIWRFYRDGDAGWKWQRLSINKIVIAESRAGFEDYSDCIADATEKGYQSGASQAKMRATAAVRSSYHGPYTVRGHDVLRAPGAAASAEKRAGGL